MKYLVMECHPAYAVVLDEKGSFHKVANQDFKVGQTVEQVIFSKPSRPFFGNLLRSLTIAACVLLVLGLCVQYLLTPAGRVRLSVNPDVMLTVNRLDLVIDADGLNSDGVRLLENCNYRFRNIHKVLLSLTQQAEAMDFLSDSDTILLLSDGLSNTELLNWAAELDVDTHSRFRILTLPETVLPTYHSASTDPSASVPPVPTQEDDGDDDDDDDDTDDDDDAEENDRDD